MIRNESGYECVIQTLRTANVLWRESRRFFRPFGISEAQFNVLNLLGQSPEGMSQRELSDRLLVDRSNVTLLLDRMEKKGWIVRHDVPGDRRVYRVILTRTGKALWQRILPSYHRTVEGIVRGLSASDIRSSMQTLKAIELQSTKWK